MADNVEEHLIHCIYSSVEVTTFSHDEMIKLLAKVKEKNAKLNVTGMLLYDEGSFFQVLEGPKKTVTQLFEKISKDKRHDRVTKIIQEPIEDRNFAEWTMGYSGVTREELKKIEGLNDFFYTKKCFTELDEGRAKTLLEAFKKGQWRASLK